MAKGKDAHPYLEGKPSHWNIEAEFGNIQTGDRVAFVLLSFLTLFHYHPFLVVCMAPSKSQAGQKKGQTKASKLATKKRLAALKLKMTKKKAVNQTQSTVGQVPAGPSQVQPQQSQAQQCPPPPPPAVTSSQNAGDSDESETDDDLELDDNPYDFPTPDTAGKLYFQLVKFHKSASKAFGDLTPLGRLYAYAGYLSRAVFHCVSWATIFEIQLLLLDKDFTPIGGRKAVSEDEFREKYAMEIELFDLACERVPHLKKEFPSLVEVPELLFQLAAFLDAKVTSTRSEDIYSLFSGIFECVRLYLRDLEIVSRKKKAKEGGYSYDPDDDDEDIALPNFSSWTEKENRGFQNENIAPLLVPALMVDDYLRDRKSFVEKMRDGKIPYNSKTWPIYIWLNQTVDKSFMDEGLLMGELIGYVWQHIFLGPRAVGRGVPKRLRGQAKKWRIRRVTFGSVCYAAMLVSASPPFALL
ncbi:hypothetical protein CC2G_013018 [Coprinopsis cinerea AmutBmut pab1-1]|nr:hypothetical protein CC2G_013018 [Coprinopsis cinerea AmutBmut pab1-1]